MEGNLYIFSNGNNDLSYYVRESSMQLIKDVTSNGDANINVFGAFSYKDIDKDRLWTKYPINSEADEAVVFSYDSKHMQYFSSENFYKPLEEQVKYLDIETFLQFFNINEGKNNIVVLSGHGGLFQSLLDMSQNKMFAINTIKLCNDIKVYPIDLLILDMCSMNYLEIAYQLLIDSKVENIAFFKGLTPIEGLDLSYLYKVICDEKGNIDKIKVKLLNSQYPIFILSKASLYKMEKIKVVLNDIGYNIINNKSVFNNNLDKELKSILNKLVEEGASSLNISGLPLKFIGYELKEKEEKQLYRCYEFSKSSYWGDIVAATVNIDEDFIMPITIPFTVNNFKHLIRIHNSSFSADTIEGVISKYKEKSAIY